MDADACLTLMTTIVREKARLDAALIRTQARFVELRSAAGPDPVFSEFAASEIAIELDLSCSAAAAQLKLAHTMTYRLPATLAALEAGAIDLGRARAVADATGSLSQVHAAAVEEKVLARGGRASHTLFRQALRRAVLAVDPDGAQRRHEKQRRERQVRIGPLDDGMAELWAFLPAAEAQAAYQHIDALARCAGAPDDPRSMDERRADVLTDLLLGRHHDYEPVHIEIGVIVPADTLLGLTDTPGELAGYGPISAGLARDLACAANATWRRILTDPVDGSLLDVSRRRFPSAVLARHVQTRDRTCRFPSCRRPAAACDLDHVQPHAGGGTTDPANLLTLCRRHHRMKHGGKWSVNLAGSDGSVTWTSPEKRVHHTSPEPYIDCNPNPNPNPDPNANPEPEPPPF